jgi:hypothetical protein
VHLASSPHSGGGPFSFTVYSRFFRMLNETRPYILKGKVEEDFTAVTLTVGWIEFLDKHKGERGARQKRLLVTSPLLR